MENWGIAPTKTRVMFVVGVHFIGAGILGIFVFTAMEEFETLPVPGWLIPACGGLLGGGFGLSIPLTQGRFPGGYEDPPRHFSDDE